jgi:integrase
MRIGEAAALRVCDVIFGREGQASKIALKAKATKSRKKRVTFISPEATEILRQYLGERINRPDEYIFPRTKASLERKKKSIPSMRHRPSTSRSSTHSRSQDSAQRKIPNLHDTVCILTASGNTSIRIVWPPVSTGD